MAAWGPSSPAYGPISLGASTLTYSPSYGEIGTPSSLTISFGTPTTGISPQINFTHFPIVENDFFFEFLNFFKIF
jgi:hypothetical protein